MKIAFISANRERLPDPTVPIGLLYLMANLPDHHVTQLWDLCFETDPLAVVARRLAAFQPQLIAVGLRNIQNNDYTDATTNLAFYAQLIAQIRAGSAAPIVVGGGGFSVIPEGLMRRLRPDYGIVGEGEQALAQLVACLEAGRPVAGVGNLCAFHGGELAVTPPAAGFIDIDALVAPDRGLVDGRYYAEHGTDSIQTKRGCPLKCDYCKYPTIEGAAIRQRDPQGVVEEMLAAQAQRPEIEHFFIVDSVFNLPARHAREICRAMIRNDLQIPWSCYANPIGFDAELADLMTAAGCAGMEVGADSGVDAVLARLRKGFSTAQIRALRDHCAATGLRDCHTFILGTPGESLDDARRTLDFCIELDPAAAILMIWHDEGEALANEVDPRRRALRGAIEELTQRRAGEFPRWFFPSLKINFNERFFRRLRGRGLRGPLWQHLPREGGTIARYGRASGVAR